MQKKPLSNKSRIVQLSPFVNDHGFLRSRGRLGKASIILCSRYPVILDAENPSIDLYLKHVHDTNGHCGLEFSRALIQQQFWILKARKVLRRIIRHCITCRRQQKDVIQPILADLPKEKLPSTINYPFRTTGIDYMGPFFIETPRAEKRYVLFFTCLVTRAVHIEVTAKLNTDDTILAIRRFICRRGQPQSIRSDNATTFVSANKDLKAALKKLELASPEISARLGLQHIAWYFNPPAAPHFGGAWERLIRSFKHTVYKIVGSRTPHEPTLHTFACEVEAIMNNRPLLHVSSDVTDILPINGFTVIFPILNISVVCTRVLLMPSTRKQKKARKSRGLEMLSNIGNLDIMIGERHSEREESVDSNLARRPEIAHSNVFENNCYDSC